MKFKLITYFLSLKVLIQLSVSGYGIPKPFDDNILSVAQLEGQSIEHLGRIIKLDTLFSSKNINHISSKFSIFNRHNSIKNIPFNPSKICFQESKLTSSSMPCYDGTYQYDIEKLNSSGFNPNLKTVIMISGFLTKDRVDWMERTKDLWLQLEDANIILVTWQDANRYLYSSAVANTPLVARQITIFLYYLAELNNINLIEDYKFLKRIHFIGHSLGAHIAGFVGQDLNGKIGRITGLDPAGPSFDRMKRKHRLDKKDAILVDVIHTNSGQIHYINAAASGILKATDSLLSKLPLIDRIVPKSASTSSSSSSSSTNANYTEQDYDSFYRDTAWFGINLQLGHLDYYANNGKIQPGCGDLLHICDHGRSNEIFEDILRYEIELMRYTTTRQNIKQSRLLAFQAPNYDNFSIGENFNLYCPKILENINYLHNIDNSIKSCSIPIDLLTPVDELIEEFRESYNIDFSNDNGDNDYNDDEDNESYDPNRKYYFKTLSTRPLVSDHYILKIHLSRDSTFWTDACSLKIDLIMENSFKNEILLNEHANLVESGDFYGIIMPYVTVNGVNSRDALNNILLSPFLSDNNKQIQFSGFMKELLFRALPNELKIQIKDSKNYSRKSLYYNLKEKAKYLLFLNNNKNLLNEGCYLGIELIEIQPLLIDNNDRDSTALYKINKIDNNSIRMIGYDECDKNNPIKQARLKNPFIISSDGTTTDTLNTKFDSLVVRYN